MNAGTGSNNGTADTLDSTIGTRLRDARIAHQLNLEKVAEELRLDTEIIRAIESDDATALPAPIFVRGYLRSYARLVGLPEDELIRKYNSENSELPPLHINTGNKQPLVRLPSARLIRNVIIIMLAIIALWLAWPFVEKLVALQTEKATEQVPGRLELPPEFNSEQPSDNSD